MSTNYLSSLYKFEPDLNAYFARIGYNGSRDPTLETLRAIQWNHLRTIPFENLDVHISGKVSIDPVDIQAKLVGSSRGGYCFEHNCYAMWVLRSLGYDVTPILARNRWMKDADVMTPATHIVLKVKIDDKLYVFDVGFSSNASPYPLEIHTSEPQPTALETRRVVYNKADDSYMHQMLVGAEWKDVFRFVLDESFPYDWEVGNYYVYSCKTFVLCNSIVLSFASDTHRYTMLNNAFTTRDVAAGTSEVVEIWSEAEYVRVLREVFKIRLGEGVRVCPRGITWRQE